VSTSNQKQDLDTNPIVARNTNLSNVGDQSSSWGTPFSPNNVMPSNQNKSLTAIESSLNVPMSNHKQDIDTNPMVIARNTDISTVGDKSSSCSTPFSPTNVMLSNKNEGVTMIASSLNVTSINPESGVNIKPTAEGTPKSDLWETSHIFWYTIFAKQCHALQSEQGYNYN